MYRILLFILTACFIDNTLSYAQNPTASVEINVQENAVIHHTIASRIRKSTTFQQVEQSCNAWAKEDIYPVHCATLENALDDLDIAFQTGHIQGTSGDVIAAIAHFNLESGSGSYRHSLFVLSKQKDGSLTTIDSLDLPHSGRCIGTVHIEGNTIVVSLLAHTGGTGGQCVPSHQPPLRFVLRKGKLEPASSPSKDAVFVFTETPPDSVFVAP